MFYKIMKMIYLFILSFFLFNFFFINRINAATIKFDKTSLNVAPGKNFDLQVNIDAGENEIRSADIYFSYDSNFLQVESVGEGTYFPTVTSDTATAGSVYIAGMVDDPAVTKTGSGTVATINFKAIKDGSTTISLNCSSSKIIKADINATNILDCTQTSATNITIGTSATGEINPTPPTSLPRTGIFENFQKSVKPGIIFLLVGGILRLLL